MATTRHYGVFTRDVAGGSPRLVASTPADAVKYKFDGWAQVEDSTDEAAAKAKAERAAARAEEPTAADEGAPTGDVAGDTAPAGKSKK